MPRIPPDFSTHARVHTLMDSESSTLISGPPASGKSTLILELFSVNPDSLLLVPTATMAEHLRHWLTRSGTHFRPDRIQTLAQFLDRHSPVAAAPDGLVHFLLQRELEKNPPPRFREVADQPGFIKALLALFAEARPELLPSDLRVLFTFVRHALTNRQMGPRHARVAATAKNITRIPLPALVLCDGFFKFSRSEQELLIALAGRTKLIVTLPNSPGAEQARLQFLGAGFEKLELAATVQGARAQAKRRIVHAETIEAEAEQIARSILERVADRRPFREIGIVLRQREPYGSLLETTLARFGIPVRSYFTTPVSAHPAAQYLTALVRALLHGWDHERLLRALRMPVSGLGATSQGDEFDFALRERIPGYGLPIPWKKLSPKEKLPALPGLLKDLAKLDSWRRDRLESSQWAVRISRLTGLLPLPQPSSSDSRQQVAAWRSTAAALNAFQKAAETVGANLADAGPLTLEQYWQQVETTLALEQLRIPDDRRNVVHLLDAYEARQWELPVVFVCGLTERHFPKYHQQDPILGDPGRASAGLDTSIDYQLGEELLFQLATTRATSETVLSYPRFDEKGDKTLPSFFLETGDWTAIEHEPAQPRPQPSPAAGTRKSGSPAKPLAIVHDKLSASSVESFLQCPFQFYVRKTLELRLRPKAPRDRLDALLQGTILHEALAEWTRAPLLNADVLDQVFEHYIRRQRVPLTYRSEAVRLELKRHFAAFVSDTQVPNEGWEKQVEVQFDFPLSDALTIRGRIDRMDIASDGRVLVIDYKYSAPDKIKGHVSGSEAGDKVQGGLYLLAAQRHFGHRPAGMLFCGLKKGVTWDGWHSNLEGLEKIGERYTAEGLAEMVAATEQRVLDVHAEILSGKIDPAPLDTGKCVWCEARDICRVEISANDVASAGGSQ